VEAKVASPDVQQSHELDSSDLGYSARHRTVRMLLSPARRSFSVVVTQFLAVSSVKQIELRASVVQACARSACETMPGQAPGLTVAPYRIPASSNWATRLSTTTLVRKSAFATKLPGILERTPRKYRPNPIQVKNEPHQSDMHEGNLILDPMG
jgi:hypothetical protein